MSEFKNMKIRITSPEHCQKVLNHLNKEGYAWPTAGIHPRVAVEDIAYVYAYNTGKLTWDDEDSWDNFVSKINQEVTLEQKPIEYFLKPVTRYNFKIVNGELFINDFKVKQEDINQWLGNVDG